MCTSQSFLSAMLQEAVIVWRSSHRHLGNQRTKYTLCRISLQKQRWNIQWTSFLANSCMEILVLADQKSVYIDQLVGNARYLVEDAKIATGDQDIWHRRLHWSGKEGKKDGKKSKEGKKEKMKEINSFSVNSCMEILVLVDQKEHMLINL